VSGLHKVKHLDSLSLREQQDGACIDPAFLDEIFEVRKLFLSGNLLTTFAPSVDFLNLQYLELANCGLESLPEEFGQMVSNVRVLNLNFNALKDIKPLLGIIRLKKLHLAGNRLARLRKTSNVLANFSSLCKVDLRNNPLTLGFYSPVSEKRLVVHDNFDNENEPLLFDPFTLEDGNRGKDTAYAGRLDMETRMRRRVYEILMLGGSVRLKTLDGLVVDRADMAARDKIWEELVKAGIVYDSSPKTPSTEAKAQSSVPAASDNQKGETGEAGLAVDRGMEAVRHKEVAQVEAEKEWPAEDSFA
jgi:hypothetical protein